MQIRCCHILVETLTRAQELQQKILEGGDGDTFIALAKAYSQCPSGANGGDLGFFGPGQMVKPFEEAAYALNPGDVSIPVQTQFGYHLIWRIS
jgi:peptidyl-prolyl cis-trans isomerase C